jgi:putative transposase
VGSACRELLDHIIPLNEYHLRWLGRDYLTYYYQDRTHIGLNKRTPAGRSVQSGSPFQPRIVSKSRLGGFHHRYGWSEAA